MRSLLVLVLVACLPFISARSLETNATIAKLTPKVEKNEAAQARSYHLLDYADTSEEESPAAESESDVEADADNENVDEEDEETLPTPAAPVMGEPELTDESEEEEEENEEREEAEAEKADESQLSDDDAVSDEMNEQFEQQYKMRGVVTSSLGYQYYIGQQILHEDKKGSYSKGRVIDFTSSGIRIRSSKGKMFNVLKDWKIKVIPLEVPSTCSFFRHMNVLVWKSNKYTLARIESAYYSVRLDRGGTKWFYSKLLRPMRVRLCEASKTKDIESPDVLVRDSATGGYWLTGRVERKSSNNKYVIRRDKDRQQVTEANRNNNIIVNKEPSMRSINVGSRVVANIGGAYRPGTVVQIKYNYVIKKTNKKGSETPENLVIVPKQPWYIAWRIRPGRGGGKGISTLKVSQKVIVIKNERGLHGQVIKEITSRDGRKTVHVKVIVPKDRKREFTKGLHIWVKVREIRYYANVITVGPHTSYAVIKITTQGSARPSRLWKYIKKTLTSLATKRKGDRFYGYHKCFNYFGTVLKNVPQNNQRSTRTRMVDVLFKTVGNGGTRNVPEKNKGISVKMLGRYYEGMVVKKELMQFTARFRVSTTIDIKILEKVDSLRNGFQRRISKLDKSGFVIWGKFSGRNFPSMKRVTYNPSVSGVYVSFKILSNGNMRRGRRISPKFGSITSSATVLRTSGQYAYVRAYVPRDGLRIAYGKEIDRIRDDVFQSVIRTRALNCGGGEVYGSGGLGDSQIIRGNGQYINSINKWMKEAGQQNVEWSRCYSAKKDGWSSHTFHKKCDNKGPSITIVQVGNSIFGGYSSVAWRTNAGYIKSNKNFLFTLRNNMNKPPFKMMAKSSGNHAIYSNNGYGPTFGGGHDLYIVNGNGGSSYSNLGYSYVVPGFRYGTTQIKSVLAGKYKFKATNCEVFIQKPKPGAGFAKSRIIGRSRSYIYRLNRWLAVPGYGGGTWSNCYRATRDGWASSTFHRRCNNKGATVTLVKTRNGNIFGGFNEKSWTTSGYKRTSSSFLFSLKNKAGIGPVKLWPKSTRLGYSTYNNNGYGPTFGGGHDLYIANNAGSNTNSYSNLGHSYTPPKSFAYGASKTKNILAGSYKFKPVEVEVYNV